MDCCRSRYHLLSDSSLQFFNLIEMLQAVNDLDRPIDQTLDTYFDRENLTYWLAF